MTKIAWRTRFSLQCSTFNDYMPNIGSLSFRTVALMLQCCVRLSSSVVCNIMYCG